MYSLPAYRSALRGLVGVAYTSSLCKCATSKASAAKERQVKDKVMVITGGSRGLGYTMADNFLRAGAKTAILLDLDEETGAEAVDNLTQKYGECKAVFMKCNVVCDLDEVACAIMRDYEVDFLLNNAGVIDETSVRRTIEINTIAVVEWGMKFWDYMRKDTGGRGGTILNVASIYGFVRDPWLVFYKASKHGVIGFTKTLGHDYNYQKSGVRVIAICPGFTRTAMTEDIATFDYQKEDFLKFAADVKFQDVQRVGISAIEIFEKADSGACWVAKENKPIEPAPVN